MPSPAPLSTGAAIAVASCLLLSGLSAPRSAADDSAAHALAQKFADAEADAARKAADAEAAKKAEEEKKRAEEKKREAARIAEEARREEKRLKVEEAEMLERARTEAGERQAQMKREDEERARAERERAAAEDARRAEEAKRAEAERLAKEDEDRERRAAEDARRAEEVKRAEAERLAKEAEERRLAEERERRAAEDARRAEEAKRAERLAKEAEERRLAEERERRAAEEARRAEEAKRAEAGRLEREAQERLRAEEQMAAEAMRVEEARRALLEAEREEEARRLTRKLRKLQETRSGSEMGLGAGPHEPNWPGRETRRGERAAVPASAPETHVAVLLIMDPGTTGIRRFGRRTADPVLCVGPDCYVSAGADKGAIEMTRGRALGPGNTLGRRAGACNQRLLCIFRDVDLKGLAGPIQPVDLRILRHDRREEVEARADRSCEIDTSGHLSCATLVRAKNWRAWIVPEQVAASAGALALEAALEAGLSGSRAAVLGGPLER